MDTVFLAATAAVFLGTSFSDAATKAFCAQNKCITSWGALEKASAPGGRLCVGGVNNCISNSTFTSKVQLFEVALADGTRTRTPRIVNGDSFSLSWNVKNIKNGDACIKETKREIGCYDGKGSISPKYSHSNLVEHLFTYKLYNKSTRAVLDSISFYMSPKLPHITEFSFDSQFSGQDSFYAGGPEGLDVHVYQAESGPKETSLYNEFTKKRYPVRLHWETSSADHVTLEGPGIKKVYTGAQAKGYDELFDDMASGVYTLTAKPFGVQDDVSDSKNMVVNFNRPPRTDASNKHNILSGASDNVLDTCDGNVGEWYSCSWPNNSVQDKVTERTCIDARYERANGLFNLFGLVDTTKRDCNEQGCRFELKDIHCIPQFVE